jgi:hypothetical protein
MAVEIDVSYFVGAVVGAFPYHNADAYGADVLRMNTQLAANLTFNFRYSMFNIYKIDFEVEMVPLLMNVGGDIYSTSYLGDNCMWTYYNYHTWYMENRMEQNFARCKLDMKDYIDDAPSLGDVPEYLMSNPLKYFKCQYDDKEGRDIKALKFVSGDLISAYPLFQEYTSLMNRDDQVFFSYCLGNMDWATSLIPSV